MMRQSKGALAIAFAFAFLGACGGTMSSNNSPSSGGATTPATAPTSALVITIQSLNFLPLNVTVPPGATITVRNLDGILHSVTSEAAMGNYSPGAVNGVSFDTGLFSTGDKTITIPANAAPGTVVPYFCRFHLSMMPQGTITVQAGTTAPQS
jgi:plastocyanin